MDKMLVFLSKLLDKHGNGILTKILASRSTTFAKCSLFDIFLVKTKYRVDELFKIFFFSNSLIYNVYYDNTMHTYHRCKVGL